MIFFYRLQIYLISALLTLSLLVSNSVSAQETNNLTGFCTELNYFTGKVIKHTAKFHLPIPQNSDGFDLNFQWKTYGKKEWEQRRRYPVIGIGIDYTNYGSDSIYGKCIGVFPNIIIPIITFNKWEWTIRIGSGVSYVTRDYTRLPPMDTINNAIGSHINNYASILTDIRFHLNRKWDLQAGVNFSHISDASFHQPNLGINLVGYHVGFKYYPVTSQTKPIKKDLKPLKNQWLLQVKYAMSFNESQAPLGPLFPIYIGTIGFSKRWISKNKFFGGIDASYHEGIYAYLRSNPGFAIQPGTEAIQSTKSAIFAGNEFLLGRIGIYMQIGVYIKQAAQVQGKYYEKLGANFYIIQKEHGAIKELYLFSYLKTHLSVAEFEEFGIGIGI